MSQNKIFIAIIASFILHQSEAILIRNSFDKLNDYLVDKCAVDNLDENLKTVEQLIKDSSTSSASNSLAKAAALYVDLAKASGKCDRASFEVLRDAVEKTRGNAHSAKPGRRIDKLVQKYAFQHAKGCNEALQRDYNQKMKEFDAEESVRLKNILYSIEVHWGSSRDLFFSMDYLQGIMRRQLKEIGRNLRDEIESSASNDPNVTCLKRHIDERNGKSSVDSVKLRKMYEKHVIQPCKYFLDEVDGLFEIAEFDYKVYKEPYNEQPYLRDPTDERLYIGDFMMGWVTRRVCTDILSKLADPIFKELERAVSNKY